MKYLIGGAGIFMAHLVLWPRGMFFTGLVVDAASVGLIMFWPSKGRA